MDSEMAMCRAGLVPSRTGYGPFPPHARYSGPDIEHMTRREDATFLPGYHLAWILGGLWYDESEHKLYAPMHVEAEGFNRDGPAAPWPSRKIILATSMDKGKTWHDEGDIITPETYFNLNDVYKFSGSDYSNGLCDFGFYADIRGGYFYLYPQEMWLTKGTWNIRPVTRVARCAIGDKMAPGKWKFLYNGRWDQSALGGKSSVVAPVLWPIIYSTYLQKYLCFFPSCGGPVQTMSFDGVYMGYCTDLSKQDWQWARFPEANLLFMNALNADGTDISSCGKGLRFYNYWDTKPGITENDKFQRIDVTFREGKTIQPGVQPRYTFEGHPESSDWIEGRQTKFVGSLSQDSAYAGAWTDRSEPSSYEGHLRECATSGSVSLSFAGSQVYWRALCSPDSGKADVFVDGVLRKTVDCYSPASTDYEQIVYILTGLSPDAPHTIKVVVRGDKNPSSKGGSIRHIGFEFAAECYKASAGFSSLMGKNNWNYRQQKGTVSTNLHFKERIGVFMNYWMGEGRSRIGADYQTVEASTVTRECVDPYWGRVRIEGKAAVDRAFHTGARAAVMKNQADLWPACEIQPGQSASHDITVDVDQGDAISFVVSNENVPGAGGPGATKVTWDPVITFVRSGAPAVWKPNPPSDQNLALGKYARSKRLWHAYSPSSAVDGSIDTAFVLSDYDDIASGDDWLMVDLNATYLIDRYVVLSVPPSALWHPKNLILQASEDGTSWKEVDRVTKNEHDRVERAVPAFKARYVRLYLPDGKPVSINEFELYYTNGRPAPNTSSELDLR